MKLLPRSLGFRLFLAHLVVIAVAALTLSLVAATASPGVVDVHVAMMRQRPAMGGMMERMMADVEDVALSQTFREALSQALAIAGVVALGAALAVSALAARHLVGPIQRLAVAARRIAAGQYGERVPTSTTAELNDLALAFNAMAAGLEESEARRAQLIGDVAHELRTPLSTIEGYLEGLQDGVVQPRPETWSLLRDEAGRVRRLVEDLNELWRAESRQLPLDLAAVSPSEILRATVARFEPQFAARGLALSVALPAGLPLVRADRDRAIQVVTILLANALRYTPTPGQVEVGAAQEGDSVAFAVRDSGVGLAAEDLLRVFDRFYRVDRSRSRASGGAGVGLTIARALVQAMGGRIWATSPGPGHGATFSFTLPLA